VGREHGHGHEVAGPLGSGFAGVAAATARELLWRTIHLSKLPRLEKKVRVALDRTLDLLFRKDIVPYDVDVRAAA